MKEDKNPEIEPDKEKGFGNLLKSEREKKGLSISQVAEITRLREHYVEALENEDWEKLPARVFVKGFIRSYALSIDLDLNQVMRVFEKSAPQVKEEDFSKALITAEKSKNRIIYLLIPLIAIAAILIYFASGWDWNKTDVEEHETASKYMNNSPDTSETTGPAEQASPVGYEDSARQEVDQKSEITEADLLNMPVDDTEDNLETGIKHENFKEVIEKEDERGNKAIEPKPYLSEEITVEEDTPEDREIDDSAYLLTGIVSMRTYIKIYVDDNPPKEYIFRPGSKPQWTGEEGFYVVIGNAAGIEFDFNGTMVRNLGKSGKVRRIRFPEDFQSEWEE